MHEFEIIYIPKDEPKSGDKRRATTLPLVAIKGKKKEDVLNTSLSIFA
jgi:hypothetical protein